MHLMLDSQREPGNAEHRFAIAVTVADNKRFKKHLPKNIIPHYPSSGQMMGIIGGLTEAVPIWLSQLQKKSLLYTA